MFKKLRTLNKAGQTKPRAIFTSKDDAAVLELVLLC
jgi:hypothetical protein